MEQNNNSAKRKKGQGLKPFTRDVRESIIKKYKNKPKVTDTRDELLYELKKYKIDFIVISDLLEELGLEECEDEINAVEEFSRLIHSMYEKGVKSNLRRMLDKESGSNTTLAQTCLEIIACTENIARLARRLPVSIGMQNTRQEINKVVAREIEVIVEHTKEGWLKVKLPFLLPKKEKGSNDYLRDVLYCALQDYFSDREPVKFDRSVIVIKHVYGKERKDKMRCDHDNFEINFIIDAIALFAIPDDSPEHCKMFSYSVRGEKEHSSIYLVPEQDFIRYYTHNIMRDFS